MEVGSGRACKLRSALEKYVADLIEDKIRPEPKFAINDRLYNSGGWLYLYDRKHLKFLFSYFLTHFWLNQSSVVFSWTMWVS